MMHQFAKEGKSLMLNWIRKEETLTLNQSEFEKTIQTLKMHHYLEIPSFELTESLNTDLSEDLKRIAVNALDKVWKQFLSKWRRKSS